MTEQLQQAGQQTKPVVSVVFRLHEDASAHIPVLERGHGLAFELPFFPQEGSAQLTDFLGELTAISSKGATFAGGATQEAIRAPLDRAPLATPASAVLQQTGYGFFVHML